MSKIGIYFYKHYPPVIPNAVRELSLMKANCLWLNEGPSPAEGQDFGMTRGSTIRIYFLGAIHLSSRTFEGT